MKFTGQIRFPDLDHPGVPVTFQIEEAQAEILLDGESLGRWSLFDVHAQRLVSSAFEVSLRGQEITFIAENPMDFAYRGVEHMAKAWARFKAMNFLRRFFAVRWSRRGSIPSRVDELAGAMVDNLERQGAAPEQVASAPGDGRHLKAVPPPTRTPPPNRPAEAPQTEVDQVPADPVPAERGSVPADPEPAPIEVESAPADPEPETVTAFPVAEPSKSDDRPFWVKASATDALEAERAAIEEERRRLEEDRARLAEEREAAEREVAESIASARAEIERLEAERAELTRLESEHEARERLNKEQAEQHRKEAELLEAKRSELAQLEAEREEAVRREAERLESERAQAEAGRLKAERLEAERLEEERVEAERLEAERAEAERLEEQRRAQEAEADEIVRERLSTSAEGSGEEQVKDLVVDLGDLEKQLDEPVPEPALSGADPKSGLMGAVRAAFTRGGGRNHVHDFVEAPAGIGMVRSICRECGYVSITTSD